MSWPDVSHASCSQKTSEYPDVTHRLLSEPIIFFAMPRLVTGDIMPGKDAQVDIRIYCWWGGALRSTVKEDVVECYALNFLAFVECLKTLTNNLAPNKVML